MKFKTALDEMQYKLLNLDEVEVRKRLTLVTRSKDRKRSRTMKDHWRRNKHELKKGMDKWHKSTKGKRFHRALGRFNALRETVGYTYHHDTMTQKDVKGQLGRGNYPMTFDMVNDALLSLSSIETHLNLELQFYEPDPEAMAQFLTLIKMFQEDAAYLKTVLITAYHTGEMDYDDYDLLQDIIQFFQDPKMYVYAKRELSGFSNDVDSIDFTEQVKYAESVDLTVAGNEIYEAIDKMFVK